MHAAVLWLWHLPILFEASLRSDAIHATQHASFLVAAAVFWWSVLGRSSRPAIAVLGLFTTALHASVLGALITLAPVVLYPSYAETAGMSGMTALDDPEGMLDEEQRRWLRPPGRAARVLARAGHAANRRMMRRLFRLEVRGSKNLPAEGPFVVAPNHASYLDPCAVAAALPPKQLQRIYWAGWTGILFTGPARRAFARLARVLPIDPAPGAASSLAFGGAVLARGHGLVWFPEGARSTDGVLQPFRPGIGLVLARRPVPVVPVVIRGSHDAWSPSRRFPRRWPISVEFLSPVGSEALASDGDGGSDHDRIVDALHLKIAVAIGEGQA